MSCKWTNISWFGEFYLYIGSSTAFCRQFLDIGLFLAKRESPLRVCFMCIMTIFRNKPIKFDKEKEPLKRYWINFIVMKKNILEKDSTTARLCQSSSWFLEAQNNQPYEHNNKIQYGLIVACLACLHSIACIGIGNFGRLLHFSNWYLKASRGPQFSSVWATMRQISEWYQWLIQWQLSLITTTYVFWVILWL